MHLHFWAFILLCISSSVYSESQQPIGGALYPPGLLPLINRANVLLSSGQFQDAAKAYSEAIEQSPADYLLYYKRATAYYSSGRHNAALEDFDKVLELTKNDGKEFDMAWLMKARVQLKEGMFAECRASLERSPNDAAAADVLKELEETEKSAKKAENEKKAQLWNACIEDSSSALRVASHSVQIRETRMACEMAAGDLEGAVGDLTRLSHLLPPSTSLQLVIARLSFFLLPASPAAMNALKQCLHTDPDNKSCLSLHRQIKNLDKAFTKMEEASGQEDWSSAVRILTASGKNNDLLGRFDTLLNESSSREQLLPQSLPSFVSVPNPLTHSPRRQSIFRVLCKSYTHLNLPRKAGPYCEELLGMDGCSDDVDGLVGLGDSLVEKEELDDAVRAYEKAFEASGRSSSYIRSKLQRVKQLKRKDYYKVLGVPRDADQKAIKKAFRDAAKRAHPDKGGSEAKMAAVNEAYEVLSNPELRSQFDAGHDPNDPMAQQGGQPFFFQGGGFPGGQHPFAQFFQQQGGGQSSFQFHFQGR